MKVIKKITNKIIEEQSLLNEQWQIKRRDGMLKYILSGVIRCFFFIGASMILYCFMDKQHSSNNALVAVIIASIIIPIISWFGNEFRFFIMKKKPL